MQQHFLTFLKGVGMGAANVVPGVSGGTIAFITGIVERLVNALKSLNGTALKLLLKGKIRDFVKHTDLYFLIALFAGIAISTISIAKLLQYLFVNYQVMVWSYFFGLILASVYYVGRTITKWTLPIITLFIVGFFTAMTFTILSPASETNTIPYNLLSGAIAAAAMILPGLSGSFVLLLLGNYQLVMIDAISNFDFAVLIPVGVGAVIGIVLFSYFLSWIFAKYKNQTISLMTGFILGSLAIIWPWKQVVETYIDRHGEIRPLKSVNILPDTYSAVYQLDPCLLQAILLMLCGVATIFSLEYIAEKLRKNTLTK